MKEEKIESILKAVWELGKNSFNVGFNTGHHDQDSPSYLSYEKYMEGKTEDLARIRREIEWYEQKIKEMEANSPGPEPTVESKSPEQVIKDRLEKVKDMVEDIKNGFLEVKAKHTTQGLLVNTTISVHFDEDEWLDYFNLIVEGLERKLRIREAPVLTLRFCNDFIDGVKRFQPDLVLVCNHYEIEEECGFTVRSHAYIKDVVVVGKMYPLHGLDLPIETHLAAMKGALEHVDSAQRSAHGVVIAGGWHGRHQLFYHDQDHNNHAMGISVEKY